MRNSQDVAIAIKEIAKKKKIPIKKMLEDCGLSVNTLSTMQSGGCYPRIESIIKIADYLSCSIDYLLGRTDEPSKILLPDGDKRKLIQERILTMTDDELSRMEDILNYVVKAGGTNRKED